MMEYWNIGFWENGMVNSKNQDDYNSIDFLSTVAYFLRKSRNRRPDEHHHSMRLIKKMAIRNIIILPPRRDRNSETLC